MKISRITIEFLPDTESSDPLVRAATQVGKAMNPKQLDLESNHARAMTFEHGKWTFDGPVFSRFSGLAHEVWKLIRSEIKD